MKGLRTILPLLLPKWPLFSISFIANIISAVFSVISVTMVIPFLGILFSNRSEILKPTTFSFSISSIQAHVNYFIQETVKSKGILDSLLIIVLIIIIATVIKGITAYLSKMIITSIRISFVKILRNKLLKSMLNQDLDYFTEEKRGDLSSRISNDVREIESSLIRSLELFFKEPIIIIVFLFALFKINVQLSLFAIAVFPISILLIGLLGKTLKTMSFRNQQRLGSLISIFDEIFSSIKIIKSSTAENIAKEKFKENNQQYSKLSFNIWKRRSLTTLLNDVLMATAVVAVLWYGVKISIDSGSNFSSQSLIGFMMILLQLIRPAKSISVAYLNLQRGFASLIRVNEIICAQPKILNKKDSVQFSDFKNSIEFKDVSYKREKKTILHNINISVKKGQKIALVGSSGGGKTTLVDLIPRFLEISSGQIKIDDIPIENFNIDSLRDMIGYVNQEPLLFNDTVYNNILLGNENKKETEVIQAARLAFADEFINNMEDGYASNIGEGGKRLSIGEQQRISIARAILKNPPIMILDEATSALDTESEFMVRNAINNLMKDRTTIIIAHRLSTVRDVDCIYVIQNGEITENGDHNSLMNQDGLYKKLFDLQLL